MTPIDSAATPPSLIDPFARAITYIRISVTDRCDLRCVYCMAERQTFLPKAEVLSIEELDRLCSVFVGLGLRRLRLTGGEPLVRKGFDVLLKGLSRHVKSGALEELTLTTNATHLEAFAGRLVEAGVRRVNVSMDSLDPARFRRITRGGDLERTLKGIDAGAAAGLKIKINVVALRDENLHEIPEMIRWAHGKGFDLTLIETMPVGEVEQDRTEQYASLADIRADLASYWRLSDIESRTPGPARYVHVEETGGRLGFITPMSHTFCEACNRVRLTCTGRLFLCLGQDESADLREPLRAHPNDDGPLIDAIRAAVAIKPKGHDFRIERRGERPAVMRPMAMTGG